MFNTSTNDFHKTPSLFSSSKPIVVAGIIEPKFVHLYNGKNSRRLSAQNSLIGALFSTRKLYGDGAVTRARQARCGLNVEAVAATERKQSVDVKAIVSVKPTTHLIPGLSLGGISDHVTDWFGRTLLLELVSSEAQSNMSTVEGYAHYLSTDKDGLVQYEAKLKIPSGFGEVGAIFVENEHHTEMHLIDILLNGLPYGSLQFNCNSWVHPKFDNPKKRVFFSTKSYLPSQTPRGLKTLREKELEALRGYGTGERKSSERIYDYDTYNDLGDPDKDPELARPVLGGTKEFPYPRRCRTGRPPTKTDPSSESRSTSVYVPRDEQFSESKKLQFQLAALKSYLHTLVPKLESNIYHHEKAFPYFTAIDSLFNNEGIICPGLKDDGLNHHMIPWLIRTVTVHGENVLRFELPKLCDRDRFSWMRNEEFSRQTLAGLNPFSIKCLTEQEWPIMSKLDPNIYGSPESALTTELIESQIKGSMTVEQALKEKRLFIIDYHDAFMLYVKKVREIKGRTLYGSRTLFIFDDESLRPLAIELTRPPMDGKPQWKQVYTPGTTNRQLSAMHPIYRLLHPYFRYTMEINALAREKLIDAGGIIESTFAPQKYAIEMSSVIYGLEWRFDREALPADLINRGMAVEDASAPHGLKLTIEDYPYASDGLELWSILKQWVTDYVNHYYSDSTLVESDEELQAWWTEVRTVGHGDKKDELWWPNLKTPQDLIHIITTIIWVTSAHHAAANFGQYDYAGYFPNRPTITRTEMPTEDPTEQEWNHFLEKPEETLLQCYPSPGQATTVMLILDVLSGHSSDEEYLGKNVESTWEAEPNIKAAYEKFNGRLTKLGRLIDERNANKDLKNRNGAGVMPYELLKPLSLSGVTAKGVPNSISI
ncbi:Linoleate 13S-lipoxygenase 2-1 chloroplastic [Bienertia sinuspersici]